MSNSIIQVSLEGVADGLLMTREGFREFRKFHYNTCAEPWCSFLAYEDPTLKGYYNTRDRYVDRKFYTKLFNSIGKVRPSVLLNGRIAGIWSWNPNVNRISVDWFRRITKNEGDVALAKQSALENFLDESLNLF